MDDHMKCQCGLWPIRLADYTSFKVVCCKCMIGTEMKATQNAADLAWSYGETYRIGIDFRTESESVKKKRFWEFWK